MTSRFRQWLRYPLFLLCLTAGLLAFVVQSGELGTSDTMHRLQTTHWLWTSEPQVLPNEYPDFGLHGRGGRLYSWYGIGQSLLMLPADLLGAWIERWPIFSDYNDDPDVRSIVVSYTTNILVSVLTALVAFRLLRQLRFGIKESVAGVLALMLCSQGPRIISRNPSWFNCIGSRLRDNRNCSTIWFASGHAPYKPTRKPMQRPGLLQVPLIGENCRFITSLGGKTVP